MSVTTECSMYWVDMQDIVGNYSQDPATCNSDMTNCVITSPSGRKLEVACDSTLQFSGITDVSYSKYFCVCGSKAVSVPETVNCADKCYDLTHNFTTCNHLELYNGFTSGNPSNLVLNDTCGAFRCEVSGINCTLDGYWLYQCDNHQHDSAASSTHSYICNCKGPATVPSGYDGKSNGTACPQPTEPPVNPSPSPTSQRSGSDHRPICPFMLVVLGVLIAFNCF
ncbi:hypothetical protein BJX68DRAFT_259661 [Aspergillus pseudodeflectus]|uniref:Uncharacterized protein n=1 Tax=Aspergillus pseudodeflectus TaxID=176178 RepID=A0ABR4JBH5_9EURO